MVDGDFGRRTRDAVMTYQAHLGVTVTGEVDHGLRAALRVTDLTPQTVTDTMLREAAYRLRVDYAAIAAIVAVESKGQPFLTNSGRPVILFERHIMRRRLLLRGIDVKGSGDLMLPEDLVNTRPGGYRGGEREWERFDRAALIHRDAAIEACSWGLMQIMGFHWERLGYTSAAIWFERMHRSVSDHVDAFIRFIEADPVLHEALRDHRWEAVARRYNGPNYAINRYDERLKAEYAMVARAVA